MTSTTPLRPTPPTRWAALLCAAALLTACGDDDGERGPTLAGIYQVTSHTLNTESCDAPGPPAPEPYAMLLADLQTFSFGPASGTTMRVFDCADLAACRALKAEQDPNNIFGFFSGFTFDRGNGASGWLGSVKATSQGGRTSDCQVTYREHTFAAVPPAEGDPADAPTRVRVEVRTWSTTLPPGPDTGEPGPNCDDRDIPTRAKQSPCERLELIDATFIE
jgi:hypothetical protein